MSDMADHIGEVPISCTKLFIRYCVQQIQALHSCNHCPGDLEHSTVYETRAVKL